MTLIEFVANFLVELDERLGITDMAPLPMVDLGARNGIEAPMRVASVQKALQLLLCTLAGDDPTVQLRKMGGLSCEEVQDKIAVTGDLIEPVTASRTFLLLLQYAFPTPLGPTVPEIAYWRNDPAVLSWLIEARDMFLMILQLDHQVRAISESDEGFDPLPALD